MSKHLSRQEIKKNELAGLFEKFWTWGQANRQRVIGATGTILVLLLLGGYFVYQYWTNERMAWRTLSLAQSYAYRGQWDDALSRIQDMATRYERSSAWGFGILLEGDIFYKEGRFQQAAQSYQKILDRQEPKKLLPFALSDLGQAQEAAKDCAKAVETDRRFLDLYKDNFLAPQTHASLARCLEALGRAQEAQVMYQQMATLYTEDAYWNQWAQSRLKTAAPPKKHG